MSGTADGDAVSHCQVMRRAVSIMGQTSRCCMVCLMPVTGYHNKLNRVKVKVYKVAVRLSMLYRLEMVALTKRQEAEMEVAELKMLRFSLVVTSMYKIWN